MAAKAIDVARTKLACADYRKPENLAQLKTLLIVLLCREFGLVPPVLSSLGNQVDMDLVHCAEAMTDGERSEILGQIIGRLSAL